MERCEAKKKWDDFWVSGKVEDYLRYRSSQGDCKEHKEDVENHGTVSSSDRDGANHHADFGI